MDKYLYDIIKELQNYGNSFIITSKSKLNQIVKDMKLKEKINENI